MAAHCNLSNRATDSGVVIGEGEFRRVTLGHYTEGPRISEKCVMKAFTIGGVYEDTFFSDDINASESAIEILQAFPTDLSFSKASEALQRNSTTKCHTKSSALVLGWICNI